MPMRPEMCSDDQWTLVELMCAHDPVARIKISTVVDKLARLSTGPITGVTEIEAPSIEVVSGIIAEMKASSTLQATLSRKCRVVYRMHDLLLCGWIKDGRQCDLDNLLSLAEATRSSTIQLLQYQDTLSQFTESAVRGYALHQRIDKLIDANLWQFEGVDAIHSWQPACYALLSADDSADKRPGH